MKQCDGPMGKIEKVGVVWGDGNDKIRNKMMRMKTVTDSIGSAFGEAKIWHRLPTIAKCSSSCFIADVSDASITTVRGVKI